jgi:hypothetical protein
MKGSAVNQLNPKGLAVAVAVAVAAIVIEHTFVFYGVDVTLMQAGSVGGD